MNAETLGIVELRKKNLTDYLRQLNEVRIKPSAELNEMVLSHGGSEIRETMSAAKFLKRPEIKFSDLAKLGIWGDVSLDQKLQSQIEIELKYEGYISRQKREAQQLAKLEKVVIPETFDYGSVPGLSRELKERLSLVRPEFNRAGVTRLWCDTCRSDRDHGDIAQQWRKKTTNSECNYVTRE